MTQLIRRSIGFSRIYRGGVITIGNFDGAHIGHQALLQQVTNQAKADGAPSIVLTFEPQPQAFFKPGQALQRLTDWRQKFMLLAAAGVDVVVMLPFDARLAALSAEDFMQIILQKGLGVKRIVTGADFRFGRGRQGTVAMLQSQPDWTVDVVSDQQWQGTRISSSGIREALLASRFESAAACLGRPWTMEGRVVYGAQRGRQWGFPTANIRLGSRVAPVSGVYAVKARSEGMPIYEGVANVGVRPTVDGGNRRFLEVHLFDFNQDVYGCRLIVEFCKKLRDECRFASLDLLKEQIARDALAARAYFIEAEH